MDVKNVPPFSLPTAAQNKFFLQFYWNYMRNNVRNYTAVFLDIVPIEKGQAILPVPWVQHLIKRCKYEFLPHAMSASKDSCLTRQPFLAVPTEFEKRFLCLLRLSLCVVNELTSKRFYAILKAEKTF